MNTCLQCGAALKPGWRFCASCRAPVPAPAAPPAPILDPTRVATAAPAAAAAAAAPAFAAPAATPRPLEASVRMESRHQRLRACAVFFQIMFWLVLASGVLVIFVSLLLPSAFGLSQIAGPIIFGLDLMIILTTALTAVPLWWAVVMTKVVIRLEQNMER